MRDRGIATVLVGALVGVAGGMFGLPGLGGAASAATRDVQVVDNAYSPASITVEVGDTVRWLWAGQGAHSVTAVGGQFDSHPACTALLTLTCGGSGAAFARTFDTPGTFAYACRVHGAAMSGTVVVRQPATAPASEQPAAAPAPAPQPAPGAAAPAPPAPGTGGHMHGRSAGLRVGTVPPPPPPEPQVAEASPRPVLSGTAAAPGGQPPSETSGPVGSVATSTLDGSSPDDGRRQILLLAAAAGVVVSGTMSGAVALFGRPRRR